MLKYNDYQVSNKQDNKQVTIKQQSSNNQVTTNNNDNKNKKKNNDNKTYFENLELNNLFIEFLKLRKSLRAVNSDIAITKLINILNKYDDSTKIQMINNSIVNSWKSVFELKGNNKSAYKAVRSDEELSARYD